LSELRMAVADLKTVLEGIAATVLPGKHQGGGAS
jgi:hypothetical protein